MAESAHGDDARTIPEDLVAKYSVGEPLTFDEMRRVRQREERAPGTPQSSVFEQSTEANPYLFEDRPVGTGRFVLINAVGPGMPQQHKDRTRIMLKVKASVASVKNAKRLVETLSTRESEKRYAIFVNEMFKFGCVPMPAQEVVVEEIEAALNDAIKAEFAKANARHEEYQARKSAMLEDIKRQNEIARKISEGLLPAEASDSASICPEPSPPPPAGAHADDAAGSSLDHERYPPAGHTTSWADAVHFVDDDADTDDGADADPDADDAEEPDLPLGLDKYVVIANLQPLDEAVGPLKVGTVIYKFCGTFETEELATAHVREVKKDPRYKLFDIAVCNMHCWLEIPPPYKLVDKVKYDSTHLTDALGTRKKEIDIRQLSEQMPDAE